MTTASQPFSRSALILVMYLSMGGGGYAWSVLRGVPNPWRFDGTADARAGLGALCGLGLGLLLVFVSQWTVHRFEWARSFHHELRTHLGPLTTVDILILAVASSVGEEVLFRGALLPATGIWFSSLVFSLLHIPPRLRDWPWTASAFAAGLLFALLFQWSGDLTGPVIAHFTVNFLNLRHLRRHTLR